MKERRSRPRTKRFRLLGEGTHVNNMMDMVLELVRLMFGMALMMFHRQIADYVLHFDETLTGMFRARGLSFPSPPKQALVHNVYFALGLFVCGLAMVRIYTALPH